MGSFSVELAEDLRPEWMSFVSDASMSTVFHTSGWRNAVGNVFGYKPMYGLAFDGDEVVAVFPGFDVGSVVGETLVNPFCEYGFPVLSEDVDFSSVLSAFVSKIGCSDVLVLKETDWSGNVGYGELGFGGVETGVVHRLFIDRNFDGMCDKRLDSSLLKNARKARRDGLSVERSYDVGGYYQLYLETMRRKGSPQFPRSFFDELEREFGDDFFLLMAYDDSDGSVAGLQGLLYRDTLYLYTNASKKDAWGSRPNDLLYLEAVKQACGSGISVVDLGRTERGSGIDAFKKQFDTERYPLTSMVYPPDRRGVASVSQYRRLEAIAPYLSSVINHPRIGPKLKTRINE